jgi:hypothetical protein
MRSSPTRLCSFNVAYSPIIFKFSGSVSFLSPLYLSAKNAPPPLTPNMLQDNSSIFFIFKINIMITSIILLFYIFFYDSLCYN